jgi:bacillithiol synthase
VCQSFADESFQLPRKICGAFRGEVETEGLDGNEAPLCRIVRAKDGTERPRTQLVKDAERTERRWRGSRARTFDRQWRHSSGGSRIVACRGTASNSRSPLALTGAGTLCDSTSLVHTPSASSSDSAVRLAVDVRRLPWMRRLALDYAFEHEKVARFFTGNPTDPESWRRAIAAAQRHERRRGDIAALLQTQLESRNAPSEARTAARHLADARTVAIVTGQQAGLFGGPMFTVLKALTAIRVARRVQQEHGIPAVPVFWIDAEDHDWEEVRSCGVLDGELALREIAAEPPDGAGDRPIASLRWTPTIDRAIAELEHALPPTEFTPWTLDIVRQAYTPGRSVSESFARLLDAFLGAQGLVVFDPSDGAAKRFASDVFVAELEHAGRSALAAARSGADLVARGYHMQVAPNEGSAALFYLNDGRKPIRRQSQGHEFVLGEGGTVPASELIERARRDPTSFSPNVLLRPIVQDTLFPTACYVAGPNELAYLAQLRGIYEAFGVPMPLLQPRASATLLDAAGVRFLTRHRLPLEKLQPQDEHALNELLRTLLPQSVERAVAAARSQMTESMAAVIDAVPVIDKTLEGKARSVLGRMEHELSSLEAKILQAAKRRDETLRRQFVHVKAQAFPQGQPQERAVGGISFLDRYGPALITKLLEELPIDSGTHWILTI